MSKNQLYAASKTQAVLLHDQTKLLDLLRNNRWAQNAEIERRWFLGLFDAVREAKLLRHNIAAMRKKVRWIDLRNWHGKSENFTRVLLIAGTPTRDYQFLVHQLSRDRETVADAILQTAAPGSEQDVHQLLDRFPTTEDELASYDTIVAFDPDWESLDRGETDDNRPTALLERWVAERAGGLILVAGPENMDKLAEYPLNTTVLDLYPIKLIHRPRQEQMQDLFGRQSPGEIEFTREGLDAEFLRLGDSARASRQAWTDFGGIYACYRGFEAKKEATVYARFCDPDVGRKDIGLIFMASQPYGAGRVFYLGSGQLWRLRASDESNFARIYGQIMRFASDGRLFDDSRFGIRLRRTSSLQLTKHANYFCEPGNRFRFAFCVQSLNRRFLPRYGVLRRGSKTWTSFMRCASSSKTSATHN